MDQNLNAVLAQITAKYTPAAYGAAAKAAALAAWGDIFWGVGCIAAAVALLYAASRVARWTKSDDGDEIGWGAVAVLCVAASGFCVGAFSNLPPVVWWAAFDGKVALAAKVLGLL